jgi:opacity protein-like surface antigen
VKKLLAGIASVALVVTPIAASAQSYGHGRGGDGHGWQQRYDGGAAAYRGYARDQRSNYRRDDHRNDSGGVAIVAGLAGLLLGSALASQQSSGYSQPYAQPYGYQPDGYQPSGYSPPYGYQSGW